MYIYIYIYALYIFFQIFRSFLYIVDIYVYITISLDILSTKSCFNFFRMAVCVFSFIKWENISFKSVKISFIYDKVCFIILSMRYHALPTRYRMRYRITIGNFYNRFYKNLMGTCGSALKMVQIFTCSIQNVW